MLGKSIIVEKGRKSRYFCQLQMCLRNSAEVSSLQTEVNSSPVKRIFLYFDEAEVSQIPQK